VHFVGDRGINELVRGHRISGCDLPEKPPKYLSRKKLENYNKNFSSSNSSRTVAAKDPPLFTQARALTNTIHT
jgi:hypothetical protein